MQNPLKHIPNFITSLNLASGFLALIYTFNDDLVTSSFLILAAMIFDFMDGLSARLLKAYSAIGKELDSLADVVSFGVAPALIIYRLVSINGSLFSPGTSPNHAAAGSLLLSIVPVLMPVCAALRLAKFNIDTEQTTSFRGLPTPASALAVISVVIAARYSDLHFLKSLISSPLFLSIYTIILSVLMVSRIPLLSLKMKNLRFSGNEGRYILAVLVIIALVLTGFASAPLIIPLYIIASLLSGLF